MEHIDVSNQSLAAQEAEINRFVIRTTDLKDPVSISHVNKLHMISLLRAYPELGGSLSGRRFV